MNDTIRLIIVLVAIVLMMIPFFLTIGMKDVDKKFGLIPHWTLVHFICALIAAIVLRFSTNKVTGNILYGVVVLISIINTAAEFFIDKVDDNNTDEQQKDNEYGKFMMITNALLIIVGTPMIYFLLGRINGTVLGATGEKKPLLDQSSDA